MFSRFRRKVTDANGFDLSCFEQSFHVRPDIVDFDVVVETRRSIRIRREMVSI